MAHAPLIEKQLRQFSQPHCGSVGIDETYIKVRGEWCYLYRAVDKHGNPVDFLLTVNRDLEADKRYFRKMLSAEPLLPRTASVRMAPVPTRRPSPRAGRQTCYLARRSTTSRSACSRASKATTSG